MNQSLSALSSIATSQVEKGRARAADRENDPLRGQELKGRYVIEEWIGKGGMGQVYLAEDLVFGERCAVKVVAASSAERLEREALVGRRLHKMPGVPSVRDLGVLGDGRHFLVLDYFEGMTLSKRLHGGATLPAEEVAALGARVAGIMAAVHRLGIVHRDLSAANLFLAGREVVVLDFGMAKVSGEKMLTTPGAAMGTPPYMAPEQWIGSALVDGRTDVFGLGVVLLRALVGRAALPPPEAMGARSRIMRFTAERHKDAELRRLLPPGLGEVLLRAIDPEPERRYQTMEEFCAALEPYGDAKVIEAREAERARAVRARRRWMLWMGMTTLGVAFFVGAMLAASDSEKARREAVDAAAPAAVASPAPEKTPPARRSDPLLNTWKDQP